MKRFAKRIFTWAFYAVGALAIAYLALYAYAAFTGRELQLIAVPERTAGRDDVESRGDGLRSRVKPVRARLHGTLRRSAAEHALTTDAP